MPHLVNDMLCIFRHNIADVTVCYNMYERPFFEILARNFSDIHGICYPILYNHRFSKV